MTKLERFKIKMKLRLIIWTKGRWGRGGRTFSICHKLQISVSMSRNFLGHHFRAWDKFSGNIDYPVPHPKFMPNSEKARAAFAQTFDMYAGAYGRLRLDLAKHLLKSL